MNNIKNPYIRAKLFRNALRIKKNEICKATGISPERFEEIESGADAAMADLIRLPEEEGEGCFSGFWGHIGILPSLLYLNMQNYSDLNGAEIMINSDNISVMNKV